MGNKISYALKKSKFVLIICLILWVTLSIVLLAPLSVSWVDAVVNNKGSFIEYVIGSDLGDIGGNLSKAFSKEYIDTFLKGEVYLLIALLFCAVIGINKSMPKHDYTEIEHGSSDWANGEQYSILNKNKGILLAEKHYLPVDKRGNVNVLVVGRFRFW